jgi:[NiFe] hydrogenase large subunit
MPKPTTPPGQDKKKPKPPPEPPPPPPPEPPPSDGRIVIDPVTRIEGHLRIEVEVSGGQVSHSWSSGTLFRGIETILKGRDPEDAWLFTQRLCGVCTYVHGSTSVRCVEDAIGVTVPDNARIIRNLLMGAQFLHDHIVHFYHLHALDWVDIVSALSASPSETERLAREISPSPPSIDFRDAQSRLQTFVKSGQLGPFTGGYWGHPAYKLTNEENLLLAAHYLEALKQQAESARMHAIFGAKNPHVQSLRVGGVTCRDELNGSRISEFEDLLTNTSNFIDNVYIPDVTFLAQAYIARDQDNNWANIGGSDNFLAYGEFPLGPNEPADLFFPRGVLTGRGATQVQQVDLRAITEHVKHSWYSGSPLHPSEGETVPNYNGLNTADRYSWLKAPRYNGQPMEVGPLARVLIAYHSNKSHTVGAVEAFLDKLNQELGGGGLSIEILNSTLGRTAARALETKIIADAMGDWLTGLNSGAPVFQSSGMPANASGYGLNEAPRGALGHWIEIQNQQIGNYQLVVPSTWNFGPQCSNDLPGPAEDALVGTPVADPQRPLEILRVVHSFDPCIACAVHVIDTQQDKTYEVLVTP